MASTTRLLLLPTLLIAAGVLAGCVPADRGELDPQADCLAALAEHARVDVDELTITDTAEDGAGGTTWEGYYPAGAFSCESPDGLELTSAILLPDDGSMEFVVRR